jgi:Protein of unknown function DUF262
MEIRRPEYTVQDYCEMSARGEVRVNRQYQRSDQVWPRAAQSFLIESILLNFPIPKLFLHQKTDLRTRRSVKEIVDGQQRTRAIVDYYNDEYRLTNNVTLEDAAGKTFNELPEDLKEQFENYGLNFDLFVGATDEDVREVFRRMNSFTVPLNPEEQRHAQFQGAFKWFMRNISTAYAEAFRRAGVFGQKALVRMQDQKLLTEIVSAVFSGITTTDKRTLDRIYREHDKLEDFPEEEQADLERRLRAALDHIFEWQDLVDTPLMRPHQVYALTLAVMHMQEPVETLQEMYDAEDADMADDDVVIVNLTRLAEALEEGEEFAGVLRPFVAASSARTNVGTQRAARFEWFCRALTDDLPE